MFSFPLAGLILKCRFFYKLSPVVLVRIGCFLIQVPTATCLHLLSSLYPFPGPFLVQCYKSHFLGNRIHRQNSSHPKDDSLATEITTSLPSCKCLGQVDVLFGEKRKRERADITSLLSSFILYLHKFITLPLFQKLSRLLNSVFQSADVLCQTYKEAY